MDTCLKKGAVPEGMAFFFFGKGVALLQGPCRAAEGGGFLFFWRK